MWLARFATIGSMLLPVAAGAAPLFDVGNVSCSGTQNLSFTDGISLTCSGDLSLSGGRIDSDTKILFQTGGNMLLAGVRMSAPSIRVLGTGGTLTMDRQTTFEGTGGMAFENITVMIPVPASTSQNPRSLSISSEPVIADPTIGESNSVVHIGAVASHPGSDLVISGIGLVRSGAGGREVVPPVGPISLNPSSGGTRVLAGTWGSPPPTLVLQSGPSIVVPAISVADPGTPAINVGHAASVPTVPTTLQTDTGASRLRGPHDLISLMRKPVAVTDADTVSEQSLTVQSSRVAFSPTVSVPEPGTWLFALLGAGAMAGALRRSRR